MSLVRNEQIKLTATYLNGLAIALSAVGGLAPLASMAAATSPAAFSGRILAVSLVCISGSVALHPVARRFLRSLQ